MRSTRVLVVVTCAVAGACGPEGPRPPRAIPEPAGANVVHQWYQVTGATAGEILVSLKTQAPAATQTDSNFAHTTWTVTWSGEWAAPPGDTLCSITDSRVRLDSRLALPRWSPEPGAPPELLLDWRSFVRNLSNHENGHLSTAVAASREVDARLRALRAPCDGMETAARVEIDSIVTAFRTVDEAYDLQTNFGALQGAVWPPRAAANMRTPNPGEDIVRGPPPAAANVPLRP